MTSVPDVVSKPESDRAPERAAAGGLPPRRELPPWRPLVPDSARRRRLRARGEWLLEKFLFLNGAAAIVLIGLIFVFLFREGIHALRTIPLASFWGAHETDWDGNATYVRMWQPNGDNPKYALLPLLCGSFLVAVPAVLIAGTIGLATGVYLAEIANRRVRSVIKPVVELLAGIPTIVIGFFCLATLATLLQNTLHTHFRLNAMVGAIGVSFVIIPIIASLVDDALRAVPNELREAAYGMGATRWEMIRGVSLPAAVSGVAAALILGMGRALGETMIVLLATGNAAQITLDPFSSVRTMTATIAAELGAVPAGGPWYQALFLVGTLLFSITFALNLVAEMIVRRMRRRLHA
jgi:phosphate transport system permease protein